jgi:hypothetical protein
MQNRLTAPTILENTPPKGKRSIKNEYHKTGTPSQTRLAAPVVRNEKPKRKTI